MSGKSRKCSGRLSLEKSNSKDQIMEAYLNSIDLGWKTDGVQAAANLYFGKDVSQLSIAEKRLAVDRHYREPVQAGTV